MTTAVDNIIRNARGLSLAGTRITLYDLLDYLAKDWPPALIAHRLGLTNEQVNGALAYLAEHRDEVEAEYRQIVREASEIRHYWATRNESRLSALRDKPSDQSELRAKIQAQKARLGLT